MSWPARIFGRHRIYSDLSEELRLHLEEKTEQLMRDEGLSRREAEQAARRAFGNVALVEERAREPWQWPALESILGDVVYGLRKLRRAPVFAAVAVMTLAIGIGANTATFNAFINTLAPQVPYRDPGSLVLLWGSNELRHWDEMNVSAAEFQEWQASTHSFEEMAAFSWTQSQNLSTGQTAQRVRTVQVTPALFSTLGVEPQLGRSFLPEETQGSHTAVAILTYGSWQRILGGNPGIIGRTIHLDGKPYVVLGVLPRQFSMPVLRGAEDVLVPLAFDAPEAQDRGVRYLVGVGRLRSGLSANVARSELGLIAARLASRYPQTNAGYTVNVEPLLANGTEYARRQLPFFVLVTVLLLLLVCANLTSSFFARFARQRREIGVRFALGASRSRLLQQSLIDTLLLALGGGTLGLLLAHYGAGLLQHYEPFYLPWKYYAHTDSRVLVFCACLTLATALATGIFPAWLTTRSAAIHRLREQNQRVHGEAKPVRRLLVVAEIAVSLALLIGAGTMFKTLYTLIHADAGFNRRHLVAGEIHLEDTRFATGAAKTSFVRDLIARIDALPGIQAVGVTTCFPMSNTNGFVDLFYAEGQPRPGSINEAPTAGVDPVSANYLQTLGVHLLAGRFFHAYEPTPVTIVNQTTAERYWPHQSAVGKHISFLKPSQGDNSIASGVREVIGVIADVDIWGPRAARWPFMYIPYDQNPVGPLTIAIRSVKDADALRALTETVHEADANIPVFHAGTAEEYASDVLSAEYFDVYLLALFASIAVFLAASGIFAVLAHSVVQREAEFGLRIAVGASPRNILLLVLRESSKLGVAGLLIGSVVAVLLNRLMVTVLIQNAVWNAAVYGLSLAIVVAAIVLASLIPALRATSIDPMQALRSE